MDPDGLSFHVYRRNGALAVSERPVSPQRADSGHEQWPGLYDHLTQIERRTWTQLLTGRSPAEIAEAEGRSRAAIYFRIRGRDGRSGMVGKNLWVRLWWFCKQSTEPS